jgi:hypothetical protein
MHRNKSKLKQLKLPIKRETLRELTSQALTKVVGGTPISETSISDCPQCDSRAI